MFSLYVSIVVIIIVIENIHPLCPTMKYIIVNLLSLILLFPQSIYMLLLWQKLL